MPPALQFLVLTFAGWVNRHQDDLIEYLREENRVLREYLGPRPLRLTDAQRRRLVVRGHKLGRRVLRQVAGIVTPDTILRWYRRLIAKKYDGSACRRRGRPMTRSEVAALVVRMAVENPQWGYTRIRHALSNLGHTIARTTVKRILRDHGIDPAPERSRRTPWKTFLQAHWDGLAACDLFTVEVLTLAGLRRYLVFFVIELQTRRVTIAGIHPQPGGAWMEQQARNLTDPVRWLPADCAASDSRPRSPLHSCLWRDPDERRRSADPTSAEESQSQCLCRAVRPVDQGGVSQIESSHSARVICASSSTSTSSITIARETIRDSTTSSCNDRHLREGRTPTFGGGRASVDCSASTIERPHEWSAD